MADSDKTLKLLIELGVIGKEDVQAANGLLADTASTASNTAKATEELGHAEKGAAEHTEHLHLNHRALHKIMHMIGQETAPELGHALAAALYGPIGIAIALGAAIEGVKRAFEEEAKAAEEFKSAMESGVDVSTATKAAGDFGSAMSASAVAADEFARAMEKIKTAQTEIKTATDDAVKNLKAEATAWEAVQKSRVEAAKADIKADAASGKISKEDEIRELAELDDRAADAKAARSKEDRAKELALRMSELMQVSAAAATAEAAVPAARDSALKIGQGPERRESLIKSLEEQIKAAEERDKKIIDQIGPIGFSNNDKTDLTSKLPGAHSDEAVRYQIGKAQIESDTQLIENFRAKLKELDTPENRTKYDVEAKASEAKLKEAEEEAKKLRTEEAALKKQIADLAAENARANRTEAAVGENEAHVREQNRRAALEKEWQREITEADNATRKSDRITPGDNHSEDAAKQLADNQTLGRALAQAAKNAAIEHSASLATLLAALADIRAANIRLQQQLQATRNRPQG